MSADGRPVRDLIDLQRCTRFKAREKVTLGIRRKENLLNVDVTVGVHLAAKPKRDPAEAAMDRVGLEVSELSEGLRTFLDLPDLKGVVIQRVHAGRPAAASGLKKGDVITSIDNLVVDSPRTLQEALVDLKADYFVLETWRDGTKVPVVVRMK